MSRSPKRPSRSRPYRSVASQMTVVHDAAVRAAADAELRGDAQQAFELHRSVPMFSQSLHGDRLRLLALLGDEAPDWLIARWLTEQSRRKLWTGSVLVDELRAARRVVPLLYPRGIPFEEMDCRHPEQVLPTIVGQDWCVRQVTVFEDGGLRSLVERHAAPQFLARAGRVAEWPDAPMGGYRYDGAAGEGALTLTDLADGARIEVLDLGLGEQHLPGQHLIGRLVPTDIGPGQLFDWRPLAVEPTTATAVAASPRRWLQVLRTKLMAGRLPVAFSHLEATSMSSDLPNRSWLSLIGLTGYDWPEESPPELAEQALGELLRRTTEDPAAAAAHRHRAVELLLGPDLDETVILRRAHGHHLEAWCRLAEVLPEPAAGRCRQLALFSDAA